MIFLFFFGGGEGGSAQTYQLCVSLKYYVELFDFAHQSVNKLLDDADIDVT